MSKLVKRGSTVVIISGDERGVSGEVLRVSRDRSRVTVKGVNLVLKVRRAADGKRERVSLEAPVSICKVRLVSGS
jgi:ribosomal protein L24